MKTKRSTPCVNCYNRGMHQLIILAATYLIAVPILTGAYLVFRAVMAANYRLIIFAVLLSIYVILLAKLGASLIHDPRPFARDGVTPLINSATDNGFPSDHMLLASVIAGIGWFVDRKLGAALVVIAIIIGWGRVAAGVHHIQDVLGAMVMTLVGYGLVMLTLRFYKHRPAKAGTN
jgi:membrane-associated phospholipid phosphatase